MNHRLKMLMALGLSFSVPVWAEDKGVHHTHSHAVVATPLASSQQQACTTDNRRCVLANGGEIEVLGDLTPESPIRVRLNLKQTLAQAPYVTLTMPSMDMGTLRYKMMQKDGGIWEAVLILPVCMHGDLLWDMAFEMAGQTVYQSLILQQNKRLK
jgi:hypothetical protein